MALLTATVKLFIKRPTVSQELVPKVLKWATDVDNPDLRDRGFIYWRLLSADPAATRTILLSDRPAISTDTDNLDPILLQELIHHLSTLSSLVQRPPHLFLEGFRRRPFPGINPMLNLKGLSQHDGRPTQGKIIDSPEESPRNFLDNGNAYDTYTKNVESPAKTQNINLLDLDEPEIVQQNTANMLSYYNSVVNDAGAVSLSNQGSVSSKPQTFSSSNNNPIDLLDGPMSSVSISSAAVPQSNAAYNMENGLASLSGFGLGMPAAAANGDGVSPVIPYTPPVTTFLNAQQAKGLDLCGRFVRRAGRVFMDLTLVNKALEPIADFAIQFNKNM